VAGRQPVKNESVQFAVPADLEDRLLLPCSMKRLPAYARESLKMPIYWTPVHICHRLRAFSRRPAAICESPRHRQRQGALEDLARRYGERFPTRSGLAAIHRLIRHSL